METRRLLYLQELARAGSMRAVAEHMSVSTSTVSQQIAALAAEVGVALVEPDGRRVRLTPAGHRLLKHAGTILAAVDHARSDVEVDRFTGVLRVVGSADVIRRSLLPALQEFTAHYPLVELQIQERSSVTSLGLLEGHEADLALLQDFNLSPERFPETLHSAQLWSLNWGLVVPAAPNAALEGNSVSLQYGKNWIVNPADGGDEVLQAWASIAGFQPNVVHLVSDPELVQQMIMAGLGVGLLPVDIPTRPSLVRIPLADPPIIQRAHSVQHRSQAEWGLTRFLIKLLERVVPIHRAR